jgi:hypothetical protein
MGKIKCLKAECPICKIKGSIQLFLNKHGEIKYARTRHYSHLDKESKKPQFKYCRIENVESLKTLICQQGISLSVDKAESGQLGQESNPKVLDQELNNSSSNQQNQICLRSLVRWGVTLVR